MILKGITVVALEHAVAGPFATRQLADLGARVIKIERPGKGDFARSYDAAVRGMSSHFVWLNRSKESLTLDVKQPDAKIVIQRLLERSDVFVQNLAPGAADRLGLDSGSLRAAYPRLITCSISGYGEVGPDRNRKAYDLLIQAETGLLSITGTPETPAKAGIAIGDIAGAMYAYSGILAALLAREQTGQGSALSVSLFDALGEWMGYPMYYTTYGGSAPPRSGSAHATIAPYGSFITGDGKTVYLAVQNDREWQGFCEIGIKQPSLANDPRFCSNEARVQHREALHDIIYKVFEELSSREVIERLNAAQIANGMMNTVAQFVDHPQLKSRDRWRELDSPVGLLRALVPPVNFSGSDPAMNPIPELGQQTDSILKELNFNEETIARWRRAGVI